MKKVMITLLMALILGAALFADVADKPSAASTKSHQTLANSDKAENKVLAGTIVSFTREKAAKQLGTLVIQDSNKQQHRFVLTNSTVIVDAKQRVLKVKSLVKGRAVSVEYRQKAGKLEALKISR